MKKYFVVILMAIVVAMPSRAQVRFGLKGGLNLTQMSVSNSSVEDMFKNKAGYFAGPTIKIALPIVGLGIDVAALYDYREAEIEVSNTQNNTVTEKLKQQSIQVPINVRYGVGLGSTANLFIFAGPQFGFNIGDKSKTFNALLNDAKGWTLKSSNLSANIGIGATVFNKLQITANYNFQLGKTGDVDYMNDAGDIVSGKLKTNSWQLGLGYYF